MSDASDLLAAVDAVVRALDLGGVRYFVTGSVASSLHGEYRATNDVDIVAALDEGMLGDFMRRVSTEFVADLEQARDAFAADLCFNLIHRSSFLKVDIFPLVTAFDEVVADRAVAVTLPGLSGALRVASAEDILLAKLRWYRLGDESSEVQRRDIEGLIALTGDRLDFTHLRAWAPALAVGDLLSRFLLARRPEP